MFYYDEVFPNGKSPWSIQPIDLINENPLYGRVDMHKDFIFPKEKWLRPLQIETAGSSEEVLVLDFVADAYEDLKSYITAHVNNGYIKPTGIAAKCEVYKSYFDITKAWKRLRTIHYGLYTLQYLGIASDDSLSRSYPLKNRIFNEADFIKYFNWNEDDVPILFQLLIFVDSINTYFSW